MKKMTILIISGVFVVVGLFFLWYVLISRVNPTLPKKEIKINNAVFSVEIASTTIEQSRGLSGRDSLPQDSGMLFLFNYPGVQSFWMKDMKFPIDIIWIGNNSSSSENNDWNGNVLGFAENASIQPNAELWKLKIYNSPNGVSSVLEVNAGTVKKDNIKIGDTVNYIH